MREDTGGAACGGFTLTEMAVVLLIVALLLGGMLIPISTQSDLRALGETEKTVADIREAVIGFAASHGRLPCPATAASAGVEDPSGGGACVAPYSGFVPAVTLGVTPTNAQGFATDAWNRPIRYAVYPGTVNAVANAFTTANGMKNAKLDGLASFLASNTFLSVCASGSAVQNPGTTNLATAAGHATCTTAGKLTDNAVAVIYSLGPNGRTGGGGGTGTGEQHNPNPNAAAPAADPAFVSHPPTAAGSTDGEFDDIVAWLSPNILYNRMIAAGQLP
ncbi:MAG TPA: prepilin-type N-terminal cleavage/methylation domain-containing protein [Rhodocyclaceae bacterium]|nr:prepilin-type N-terminal cleavage/methylation domain-containing protein [Rhodocyclaceae bacterium]HNH34479.1 prepilin-type N-terminal cleavage/methylation domain-containing protein [Rhodocyclaceae bacterium]